MLSNRINHKKYRYINQNVEFICYMTEPAKNITGKQI